MNILVPVNFEKEAENAKDFAKEVIQSTGGKIVFVYANPPVYHFANFAEKIGKIVGKKAKELMKIYVSEIEASGLVGSFKLVNDELTNAIDSVLINEKIELIIMGTKGAKGLQKLLLGFNASEILRTIDTPLLFVPLGGSYGILKKIIIAIENIHTAPEYIKEVLKMTINWGLSYEILHITTSLNEDIETSRAHKIKLLEKMYPGTSFTLTNLFSKSVQEGLKNYQKENLDAILVMLSSPKNLLQVYFFKSDTEQMVFHSSIPLLVIKSTFIQTLSQKD